jgi:osmotically-inducible protein OsmY
MPGSDELIKKDVVDQLTWDDRVDASKISVEVSNGRVILRGEVPNYFTRNAAYEDTWYVAGVRNVLNELTVRHPPARALRPDIEIENAIKNRFAVNPDIDLRDIEVIVSNGTVTLKGTVDAYWKKMYAEDLITEEPGVAYIENLLAVVPTRDYIDQDIADDIVSALDRMADVDPDQVTVKVEGGKVTLSGTVQSGAARRVAHESAWYTPGVIQVEDHLTVSEMTV